MILETIRNAVDFYSHLPRYQEIIHVLFKYGFADELRLVALEKLLKIEPTPIEPKTEIIAKPFAERVRLALEELGPTFVKFGQILSSRRDLIDDDVYEQLCMLQDHVPPIPVKEARKIIREELGRPVDECFEEFEDEPIGSASIAQVHRARLKTGERVAIKVQRPDIAEKVELDTAILLDLAKFFERHVPDIAVYNPIGIISEFTVTLRKELDFQNEASNAERFAEQFANNPHVHVPRVFREYTTSRVLTWEYMTGLPIDDPEKLREAGIDPVKLAERMTALIYEQIFTFGFFHGDPHPGNLTVLPEGVIGLYDYGMMGSLTPQFRESIASMIVGLTEKDHRVTMQAIIEMSEEGMVKDPTKMLADVEAFADTHLTRPLREINLGYVLNQLLGMLRKNRLRMKSSFYLGIKALAQVEAIGRTLDPDLNFILLGEPYATRVIERKFAPKRLLDIARKLLVESVDFLSDLPHDFRTFYEAIKRGKLNIPLEHKIDPKGFEPLRETLDSIANRLANAILTASVLICSSIVLLAKVPPHFRDVSLPGLIGLIFGAYMCFRLVFSIWRHGGL